MPRKNHPRRSIPDLLTSTVVWIEYVSLSLSLSCTSNFWLLALVCLVCYGTPETMHRDAARVLFSLTGIQRSWRVDVL